MNPSDEVGKVNDLPPNGPSEKKVRKRPKPKSPDAAGGGESLGDTQKTETSSHAFSKEAPGDTVGGRYEIVSLIGEGSMGILYGAKDTKLGSEVALKRLRGVEDSARKGIARFLQEARAVAALNHRNIVTIHDLGEDDKGPFIVMEYLRGEDLRIRIEREGRIKLEEALSILKGVGQGLAYAHNRGIIHRNVKPANILLTEDGTPKLVDFGLALMPGESEISKTGVPPGTWAYMSPEQMRDAEHLDQRSDIYALAKTLCHMVTGNIPDSIDWDAVPSEMSAALEKALKPAPEDRPLSVKEFLIELGYPSAVVGSPLAPGTVLPGTCLNCGAQNPQGTRFCQSCGAGLFERCPRCGLEGPLGARSCGSCGVNVSSYKEAKRALYSAEAHLKRFEYAEAEKKARRALRLGCLTDELNGILKKAATRKKENLDELRAQAMDLMEKERYEEAEQPLRDALGLDPSHEELQRLLKELPAKIEEREVRAALTEAGKALEEKRYPVALERCEWVLEQHADNEEGRELRSRAEKLRENHRAGVAQARETVEASRFGEASEQLRSLEKEYPWDDEIKKLLQEAATRKKENLDELRAQAMDLMEKERYEEAEQPLRDALGLDPS
ncbi:protein kinase, partial [bacterium]|nr:protein kinase [bacterium]